MIRKRFRTVCSQLDGAGDGYNTFDNFDYGNARAIAATVIDRLPADRRQLPSLAYLEGQGRKALARRFDVPLGTIKTWLRRTLQSARKDCLQA